MRKPLSLKMKNEQCLLNDDEDTKTNKSEKTDDSSFENNFYQDIDQMREYMKTTPNTFKENFELLKYISSGSVGTFYEGQYKKGSKQKVGMKFLLEQKRDKNKGKNMLLEKNKEMLILKKLHNKNIISLYGNYKLDAKNSCAILELAKYGDLESFQRNILKRKYLPETLVNYFAKQILDALDYIHECKIIHFDIKQENILIDANLDVKLTDFSISSSYKKFKDSDKVYLPFAGTTKFICPEILSRKYVNIKDISKIDIYSFGVVLYYLIYGTYPYDLKSVHGRNYDEIEKKIKENKLEFPQDREISPMLVDFLKKVLEKDLHKRLSVKEALDHPWIKGSRYIFDQKEKICCLDRFLVLLITDSIPEFNEHIKKEVG